MGSMKVRQVLLAPFFLGPMFRYIGDPVVSEILTMLLEVSFSLSLSLSLPLPPFHSPLPNSLPLSLPSSLPKTNENMSFSERETLFKLVKRARLFPLLIYTICGPGCGPLCLEGVEVLKKWVGQYVYIPGSQILFSELPELIGGLIKVRGCFFLGGGGGGCVNFNKETNEQTNKHKYKQNKTKN